MNCEVCDKLKKDLEQKKITKDEYFHLMTKHNEEELNKLIKQREYETNNYN